MLRRKGDPDIDAFLFAHDGWRVDRIGDGWRCLCGADLRPIWPEGGVRARESALNAAHRGHFASVLTAMFRERERGTCFWYGGCSEWRRPCGYCSTHCLCSEMWANA